MNRYSLEKLIGKLRADESFTTGEREELAQFLSDHTTPFDYKGLVSELTRVGEMEISNGGWKKVLFNCFEKIGKGLNADSVRFYDYIYAPASGEPELKPEVHWYSDTVDDHIISENQPSMLTRQKYGQLFDLLKEGEPYQVRLSDKASSDVKSLMKTAGSKSVLLFPVQSEHTFFGLIRLDSCHDERVWSPYDLTLLHPVVFQLRNLLEKRDLEDKLQNTYRQAKIGTWEMDLESESFNWSSITREIFEIEKNRIADEELAMQLLYGDEEREQLMKAVERCKITGEPYDLELRIKTAKGNVKWVRDTGQAEFKNGKCVRLYGILQDIDKQKRAEQESEKNKRLLEAITQQTDVAVWVRNGKGDILFVNKQWKSIFGLGDKKVVGRSLQDLFDEERYVPMIESDKDVIEQNEQVIFEEFLDTAIGPRHYMVNKFPLTGISGLENAVGGIGTDITEIKKTEARLQKTKKKLREIIEHSTNLFYTHDTEHKLTYLSPQSIDFLGYAPEEAKRRWTEFVTDNPENEKGFMHTQRAIDTGVAQPPFELELIRGDGVKIWVEVNEAPVVKNGKTVSIAGSLTDITKRKMAQNKIRESLREKETLLAEIHHRVKNNLAVVASLMQLQAMETENRKVQGELLESVLRIKSMASIHEHLYKTEDFSNLDFAHNLEMLVEEVFDTMQFNADITLTFECDDVRLSVNQAIPCSLIVNEIITNIIKHGYKGRDTGEVITRLKQDGDHVTLTIDDDGEGLPDNFDPESTNTLGMQLVKTLTGQLPGEYAFEHKEVGARFRLTFENKKEVVPQI